MLKILNEYEQAYEKIKNFVQDEDNSEVWTKSYLLSLDEDLEVLRKLVDKETPKKPLIKKYENSKHYLCPNCKGRRFGIIDYGEYKNEWRKGSELMPYCPRCGQKLDWSEENE